jgi:oligosaccharide repeat unit polymerase
MEYFALVLAVVLLYMEGGYCQKIKKITALLVALIFNFIFIHFWIVLVAFDMEWEIVDRRVGACLLINDITWLVMMLFFKAKPQKTFNLSEIIISSSYKKATYALFVISACFSIYYISKVGISLFAEEVEFSRHTAKKGYGYLNMFITRGLLLSAILFYLLYKFKSISQKIFILSVFIICSIQALTGFRSYIINTVLIMLICSINVERSYHNIKILGFILIGALFFAAISLYKSKMYIYDFSFISLIQEAWPQIHHRVVMEGPRIIQKTIYIVDIYGKTHGETYYWDIYAGLPGPAMSYGDRLFIWLDTKNIIAGLAPLAPSLIGESYMNFGYIGVVIGACVSYMMFRFVDSLREINILIIALKSMFTLLIAETIYLGIGTMIVSRIGTTMFFVFLFWALLFLFRQGEER